MPKAFFYAVYYSVSDASDDIGAVYIYHRGNGKGLCNAGNP